MAGDYDLTVGFINEITLESRMNSAFPLLMMPKTLLHGSTGFYDEIVVLGGIGLVLLTLLYFAWRKGVQKKKRKDDRSRKQR